MNFNGNVDAGVCKNILLNADMAEYPWKIYYSYVGNEDISYLENCLVSKIGV